MGIVQTGLQGLAAIGMAIALLGITPAESTASQQGERVMSPVAQTPIETATPPLLPENLLVSIRREGGYCIDPGCFSEALILSDGTYRFSTHVEAPVTGRLREAKAQRLQRRIAKLDAADELYASPRRESPIDDFCGLAFDGPEVVYTFRIDGDLDRVRGCDAAIDPDHPLVKQLERVYNRISEQAWHSR